MEKNWNHERWRTRDLLLEYDQAIMPHHPRASELAMIYPWENNSLKLLNHQLYLIALQNNFNGTEQQFNDLFLQYISPHLLTLEYINFPEIGEEDVLYFDIDNKILYYWDNKYIPINHELITNLILDNLSL